MPCLPQTFFLPSVYPLQLQIPLFSCAYSSLITTSSEHLLCPLSAHPWECVAEAGMNIIVLTLGPGTGPPSSAPQRSGCSYPPLCQYGSTGSSVHHSGVKTRDSNPCCGKWCGLLMGVYGRDLVIGKSEKQRESIRLH